MGGGEEKKDGVRGREERKDGVKGIEGSKRKCHDEGRVYRGEGNRMNDLGSSEAVARRKKGASHRAVASTAGTGEL